MIDVSIIIINYKKPELTIRCIHSIINKTFGVNYEIIVVDNFSNDNSTTKIRNEFPEIKIIESEINLGFGGGCNLGSNFSNGTYLLFLNNDSYLINNAIFELYNFIKNKPYVGIVGGNLYDQNKKGQYSYSMQLPSILYIIKYRFHLGKIFRDEYFNNTKSPKQVKIIIGANLLISRSLFKNLAGFDEDYFMYVEDGDLCYRVNNLGYELYSVPSAKIIHEQGASSGFNCKINWEIRGYLLFFLKNGTFASLQIYKIIEIINLLFRSLLSLLLCRPKKAWIYLNSIYCVINF